MSKAGVFCTVEGQRGRTELLNTAQSLKFRGVDQIENDLMLDINVIMDRVTKDFLHG